MTLWMQIFSRFVASSDGCAGLHQEMPQKYPPTYLTFNLLHGLCFIYRSWKFPDVRWNYKATASSVMYSQGKTLVIRAILLIVYGFVGAAIFTLLEKREESNKTTSNRMLEELRKNFTEHQNISDKEFKSLSMAVYNAVRVGLSADWTYFRAVDFTYTALTTIGQFYHDY